MVAVGVAVAALLGAYPVGQHGLRANYFRSDNWTGDAVARIDPRPSDTGAWWAIGPDPPQRHSTAWIGSLVVDRADTYQLTIRTTASCRASIDTVLVADSHGPVVRPVALTPGVYTLAIQCATTNGRLNLGVWWDTADIVPRPLSPAVIFPYAITLPQFRSLTSIERVQRWLLLLAAAAAILLALDWARTRGPFGCLVILASAAATAAIHFDWPEWLRGPSGADAQWGYQGGPFDRPFFVALTCGVAVLAAIGLSGARLARRAPRRAALALLGLGIVAGFGFELGLLDTAPGGWRQSLIASAWTPLGFLRAAGYVADVPISDVIRRYPTIMPTLSFKATTHPPGGTVMFRALIGGARWAGLRGVEPDVVFGLPTTNRAAPVTKIALAGALIWAGSASLTALAVALAAWALTRNPLHAAVVGLLWLFCPSPTVMVPTLDQLQTFLVASSFALLLVAQSTATLAGFYAGIAGVVAGLALFVSYGTAPMLATGVLMAGGSMDSAGGQRRYALTALCFMAGAAVALLAPVLAFGFPLIATAAEGLRAHREFTVTRSATLWLRYNLLDFAMWFGAAPVVAFAATLDQGRKDVAWRLAMCACLGLLVSDLSGTARGEVGRLWMPFMPLMFVVAWTPAALPHPRDGVVVGAAMMVYAFAIRLHWIVW
jgi:hypothetical protein